jgi:hypothetical protein
MTHAHAASACYGNQDEGTLIAAASDALWNGGAACGTMYTVTCVGGTNETPNPCNPGASVTVKIVDLCPSPGCQATLDLSQQAFATIGNLGAGKIVIDYSQYAYMHACSEIIKTFNLFLPCFVRQNLVYNFN